jgi:uridine kinase
MRGSTQIAVVGASGSGKTWLARQMCSALKPRALHLSLDAFYRDLSTLAPEKRSEINFDDPAAIDWKCFREVLTALSAGRASGVPVYDFSTHTRRPEWHPVSPTEFIIWDGLWLVHEPWLRKRFAVSIFVDCPAKERLARRLERDVVERGRTPESVRHQFEEQVEPMRERFVEPQRQLAAVVVDSPIDEQAFDRLLGRLRAAGPKPESPHAPRVTR